MSDRVAALQRTILGHVARRERQATASRRRAEPAPKPASALPAARDVRRLRGRRATRTDGAGPCRPGLAHHWLVESAQPGRATVRATCRHCGARREYPAYLDDWDWHESDAAISRARAGAGRRAPEAVEDGS